MKKILLLLTFFIGYLGNVHSQQQVLRIQGHERPDVKITSQQTKKSPALRSDTEFTFEDVQFWVGEGQNKAMLVIDWYLEGSPTLVWGYKWNGEACGLDMIMAIAKADPRLTFLTHYTGGMGNTIAGFGYDADGQGSRCLYYDNDTETPYCPEDGIVMTTAYNYDSWTTADPNDYWRSGWYDGYWSYQIKDTISDDFIYSPVGASSRELQDGCVDGWGFQVGWDSWEGVLPKTPYTAALPPTDGVSIDISATTLIPGEQLTLVATVSPANAINTNISWTSDNPAIVEVDENGEITAKELGETYVRVTTEEGGYTDSCKVYVVTPTIHVVSVSLDKESLTLNVGEEYTFTPSIQPANADNKNVFWVIHNPQIATVDQNGLVKAVSAGVTKLVIITEDGSCSTSCEITVKETIEPEIESPTDSTLVISFPKVEQANRYRLYLYREESGEQVLETIYELDSEGNLLNENNLLRSGSDYISASLLKQIANAGYTIRIDAIQIYNNEERVIASYLKSIEDPVGNETVNPEKPSVKYSNGNLLLTNLNGYTFYLVGLDGQIMSNFIATGDYFSQQVTLSSGVYILTGNKNGEKLSFKFIAK